VSPCVLFLPFFPIPHFHQVEAFPTSIISVWSLPIFADLGDGLGESGLERGAVKATVEEVMNEERTESRRDDQTRAVQGLKKSAQ
jgi:hypothetical protein